MRIDVHLKKFSITKSQGRQSRPSSDCSCKSLIDSNLMRASLICFTHKVEAICKSKTCMIPKILIVKGSLRSLKEGLHGWGAQKITVKINLLIADQ